MSPPHQRSQAVLSWTWVRARRIGSPPPPPRSCVQLGTAQEIACILLHQPSELNQVAFLNPPALHLSGLDSGSFKSKGPAKDSAPSRKAAAVERARREGPSGPQSGGSICTICTLSPGCSRVKPESCKLDHILDQACKLDFELLKPDPIPGAAWGSMFDFQHLFCSRKAIDPQIPWSIWKVSAGCGRVKPESLQAGSSLGPPVHPASWSDPESSLRFTGLPRSQEAAPP